MSTTNRTVREVVAPQPVIEGAGVHLRRSIGTRRLDNLDPFLLLDHFESNQPSDYQAGFPLHPHRGIETITILRTGAITHGDSLGNKGTITAGDVQWMTSGSGILHEEMPQVRPEGIAGLQLWLNLPAKEKMTRPRYRDLAAAHLPEVESDSGAQIRMIAGSAVMHRLEGKVEGLTVEPLFIDVRLPARTRFIEAVPMGHQAFAYLDQGEVYFDGKAGPQKVVAPALVIFTDGDQIKAWSEEHGGRFLLAAGKPLGEPIARHGPFVMNTEAEIAETLQDLRSGRFIRQEP